MRHWMEDKLKEDDDKLTDGNNKTAELTQTVESLKVLIKDQDGSSPRISVATPTTPPSLPHHQKITVPLPTKMQASNL